MNMKQRALVFIAIILLIIAWTVVQSVFSFNIAYDKVVNSEIVIGIVTLSGLIFAFQPTIFKIKKTGFYRILFLVIFSFEGLILGIIGYVFALNALNVGYLTENALFVATASLFVNLFMSAYFVLVDLLIQTEEETEKRIKKTGFLG